ncbi:unnamed protein product [Adineta ricciae]|uniref:AIG1-type G domain-containing protein n=1 Tax=Adineta ricciae TaxID=249248 RepID=A0A815BB72_ADIRI|nr:unnamed protein product [Adineta ricciae]CAF1266974.1 unnamed protein product [Adineta ricciae]
MSVQPSSNGLILIGNTGVGKSFLGNILSNSDTFQHGCSASSITHHIQFQNTTIGQMLYSIYDTPGLLEDDQNAVNRNKQEISKAFQQCPNCVVIFVFTGGSGGRIRDEDVRTFQALKWVFSFQQQSLLVVVNDLPKGRSVGYENEINNKLQGYCKIPNVKICLLDHIDSSKSQEREQLRTKLINPVLQCVPKLHVQNGLIDLGTVDDQQERLADLRRQNQALDDKAEQARVAHERRMAALRTSGKGADVTYEYYNRNQPGILVKAEKDWIPIENGTLRICGPSNVPPQFEVKIILHSINW